MNYREATEPWDSVTILSMSVYPSNVSNTSNSKPCLSVVSLLTELWVIINLRSNNNSTLIMGNSTPNFKVILICEAKLLEGNSF